MHLIENKYETAGLIAIPPHARDVAEHLLTAAPLSELLLRLQTEEPPHELLARFNVSENYWHDIIHATLLAKATYFLPNPNFTREEILYLVKIACIAVKMPLEKHSILDVLTAKKETYPLFSSWLASFARLLQAQKSDAQ